MVELSLGNVCSFLDFEPEGYRLLMSHRHGRREASLTDSTQCAIISMSKANYECPFLSFSPSAVTQITLRGNCQGWRVKDDPAFLKKIPLGVKFSLRNCISGLVVVLK